MNNTNTNEKGTLVALLQNRMELRPIGTEMSETFFNQSFPQRLIGCRGNQDLTLLCWPQRSPDHTP